MRFGWLGFQDGVAREEDDRFGAGMGVHAEGDHEAEEHPGGVAGASVQLRGLYDALHVGLLNLFSFYFLKFFLGLGFDDFLQIFGFGLSERSTICALRSHRMITRSSYMISTGSRSRSTSILW